MKKKVVCKNDKSLSNEIPRERIERIIQIIENSLLSLQENKKWNISIGNELNTVTTITELNENLIKLKNKPSATINEDIEKIVEKLLVVISKTGTKSMNDLMYLLIGEEYNIRKNWTTSLQDMIYSKLECIMKYVHPISFKHVSYKSPHIKYEDIVCCNKITDEVEETNTYNDFECFLLQDAKVFRTKSCGIQFYVRNETTRKMFLVYALVDDIVLDCVNNDYCIERKHALKELAMDSNILMNCLDTLSLREILITGNDDFIKKEAVVLHDVGVVRKTKIDDLVKKVIEMEIYNLRNFILSLLIYSSFDPEIKYISHLLYDIVLIQNKEQANGENGLVYDSFPLKAKEWIKECIQESIKYTDEMNQKYDINRISLEQQVYVMKAPDIVKEKAISKLKEIKGRGDENNKSKQYLEGLLRIPFETLREEPVLKIVKEANQWFKGLRENKIIQNICPLEEKNVYTSSEMTTYIKTIQHKIQPVLFEKILEKLPLLTLKNIYKIMNKLELKKANTKQQCIRMIESKLKECGTCEIIYDLLYPTDKIGKIVKETETHTTSLLNIDKTLQGIVKKLDDSIYGHTNAKNQILKVIGQWMTGKSKGYSFGFEGSPGIGKTSLAKKGLTHCLVDVDGSVRPFHFISLGGSSNGSSLEGHGYTYQNSSWGRIVDILMESKCMNPIIYIDELDKVSKTENGKEIIGILTHLIDSTQNTGFQDKYFMGIDLDVSNVLFVFSYNRPEEIDPVLLDRIHRIQFENLSLEEKIVISKNYIFPELNEKMGWDKSTVKIDDTTIQYIIETYTLEPGIRKLKELYFDIWGEINIELLKNKTSVPIQLTKPLVKEYLKLYRKVHEKKIHKTPHIGTINGLYANSLGQGGIIPIQCSFFPSTTFMDLKLTGSIGNVMQESMMVSKNLAWNLTADERKVEWIKEMEKTKNQGIHIHCPEGATKKDGPSGGCCITLAIYSLLNKKPIRNDIAITGEIDLQGNITAIGGLEFKILGGMKAGVIHFLFPKENEEDYLDILEKYGKQDFFKSIEFTMISSIDEVICNDSLFYKNIG